MLGFAALTANLRCICQRGKRLFKCRIGARLMIFAIVQPRQIGGNRGTFPVLKIIHRAIPTFLIRQTKVKRNEANTGAITLIQRFGSAANLNTHLHALVLDGVYQSGAEDGAPQFIEAATPTQEQLQTLLDKIIKRIMTLLTRLGHLVEEDGIVYLARTESLDPDNVMAPLQAASTSYRIAAGPRAGRKVLTLVGRGEPRQAQRWRDVLCANAHGFSLHAGVHCAAEDRTGIEQLCRYITRPAISNERLSVNREGNVAPETQACPELVEGTPWRNGTTHLVLTQMEFMQRLAALVPRPRLHLIRFHGVLAPNAKLRSQVVPVPPAHTTAGEGDCTHAHGKPVRMTWARLLKRVFDIDIEQCQCGGKLKLVAVIEEPAVIEKILTHLGLAAQPPPRAPARRVELFQGFEAA